MRLKIQRREGSARRLLSLRNVIPTGLRDTQGAELPTAVNLARGRALTAHDPPPNTPQTIPSHRRTQRTYAPQIEHPVKPTTRHFSPPSPPPPPLTKHHNKAPKHPTMSIHYCKTHNLPKSRHGIGRGQTGVITPPHTLPREDHHHYDIKSSESRVLLKTP